MEPPGEGRSVPSPRDLERFGALAGRLTGIDTRSCLPALRRGMRLALERSGATTLDELYKRLTEGLEPCEALERFVAEITVGETHFFRDVEQFHDIERLLLPQIAARRSASKRVRMWSAGCSTGEEAYSLAMLADRALPAADGWDVRILATDLDRPALRRAREGAYGPWSFREMPRAYREAYIRDGGRKHTVDRRLRSLVRFVEGDLREMPDHAIVPMDLVLCRNVLMYMGEGARLDIHRTLAEALAAGGSLVLGRVEQPAEIGHGLETERLGSGLAYRRPVDPPAELSSGERAAIPELGSGAATDGADGARAAGATDDAQDAPSAYVRAKRLAGAGRLEEALGWVEFALERDPRLSRAHFLHGLVRLESGDAAGARNALRRCLFLDPGFVLGHLAMATTYARLGSWDRSMRSLRTVTELLAGHEDHEEVQEGDGLSVGDVLELVGQQTEAMTGQGGER